MKPPSSTTTSLAGEAVFYELNSRKDFRITHFIFDDGAGGGPKTVLNHITYYGRIFDVFLLHDGSGLLAGECDRLGIRRRGIPMNRLWKAPLGFAWLIAHMLARRPHLVILHGQWGAFFGALAGWITRFPAMLYVAQWPSFYTDWDLWRVVRNFCLEWVPCKLCHGVVAISPGNRDEFLRRYPFVHSKLHFIPNSIDLVALPTAAETTRLRESMAWSGCQVVCVGRLSSQKRVDWLLRAWKLVEEADSHARLSIIGGGEEEEALHELASELDLKRCEFLGPKPAAWKFIAAADLVVMPSMYEGHANIPLEAMACGRAIVACSVDGVRESFTHGVEGLLVPPANPEAMAAALLDLIANPQTRQAMGAAGKARVKAYEKGVLMRRYLALIQETFRRSGKRFSKRLLKKPA